MLAGKKLCQSLNLWGSLGLALTISWIISKVYTAINMKKNYNALQGKVVVITGAGSGLGEALAHEFYKQGCQVVLIDRSRRELERVSSDLLRTHSTVPALPLLINPLKFRDIMNSLPLPIEKILPITSRIDILINNWSFSFRGTVVATQLKFDTKIMMMNYFGSVALTKAVLPTMIRNKSGHVVFVSSFQGLVALPERSAYCASKHALQAFADSLRAEVAAHDINVTVVSPGYVKTEISLNAFSSTHREHGEMDATPESGYSPDYVATQIGRAVVLNKKEVVISTLQPKIAIFLRKYLPSMYFTVMVKRAKKLHSP